VRVHAAGGFFVFLDSPVLSPIANQIASDDIRAYMACWLSIGTGLGILGWVVVIDTILKLQYWETICISITQGIFAQVTFYTI
jgi:hypothetical protein